MYIKSPLNYTGGKHKVLNQFLPYIPKTNRFVDVFAGGFNVGINSNSKIVICNDIYKQVVEIIEYFHNNSKEQTIYEIENNIIKFNLEAKNQESYIKCRDFYNNGNQSPILLFTLICFSFNHMLRFNKKGKYNVPVGQRCFNNNIKNNLINFINSLQNNEQEFLFCSCDFNRLNYIRGDFVFCDPPYLLSSAFYNINWSVEDEKKLYILLNELNDFGIKFGLTNMLRYKNNENELLSNFMKKYNVLEINNDFSNCIYTKNINSNKNEITKEVYVYN